MPRQYNKDESKGMQRKAYLGDHIHNALSLVGITPERVSRWIGKPCGCVERREKLNALDKWVRRVLGGKTEKAEEHLSTIMQEEKATKE